MTDYEVYGKDGEKIGEVRERPQRGYHPITDAERKAHKEDRKRWSNEASPFNNFWLSFFIMVMMVSISFLLSIVAGIILAICLFCFCCFDVTFNKWRKITFFLSVVIFLLIIID
jgi:ABC-type sugar transport system permease subunit